MIDLGAWAEEKYAVPVAPRSEKDLQELMELLEKVQSSSPDDDGEHS
jgi:endogenous inhibitor of DNA gyrase (YacG/DUF329 family)